MGLSKTKRSDRDLFMRFVGFDKIGVVFDGGSQNGRSLKKEVLGFDKGCTSGILVTLELCKKLATDLPTG